MRIALTAKMGRGKSTVSSHLVCEHGFVRIGFADKLKEIVQDLRPDLFENGKKPRVQLQRVGEVLKNELGTGVWLDYVLEKVEAQDSAHGYNGNCGCPLQASEGNHRVVIDDVRFVFEATALRKAGFVIVKIDGPNQRQDNGDEMFGGHSSEQEVDKIEADFTINNDSTLQELFAKVDKVLTKVSKK